jgi:hypothetical protein
MRARRRARQRALALQQSRAQAPGSVSRAIAPPAAGSGATAQDRSFARQQQEQAARLTSDQQQVLHQYNKTQRQMQAEPRIQDSLGDQPPPYAPVIPPPAASPGAQGIQEAPGPAQTTPKLAQPPAPSSQQNQPPPASQQQSQPSSPPQ